ncbi:MAG: LytR C-terminal domain-containing protein [Candidatus Marinimicrobia bacterium]|nr:LytR C-terminal domain-containing protein [Candidatus Neomarinimicrobiota bacterium]
MAKLKRRKSSKLFSTPRKKSRGKTQRTGLINAGIAVLSLLLVAFIFSFSGRQTQSGVPIEVKFPSLPDSPKLATEIYEANPIFDVEVEILNGCGEPGLAAKFSEFLRTERVDVVRSENADHFEYEKTILIQRNENVEGMKHVAAALGFSIDNPLRVITSADPNLDVDLTLIIGKDYHSISPIQSYFNK